MKALIHVHIHQHCDSQPHHTEGFVKEFNITIEELVLGSVNKIYKRIITTLNERNRKVKYHRILSNVLPSYLQSFNYWLHNNLLPVLSTVVILFSLHLYQNSNSASI